LRAIAGKCRSEDGAKGKRRARSRCEEAAITPSTTPDDGVIGSISWRKVEILRQEFFTFRRKIWRILMDFGALPESASLQAADQRGYDC
jgi:hypothetical protein